MTEFENGQRVTSRRGFGLACTGRYVAPDPLDPTHAVVLHMSGDHPVFTRHPADALEPVPSTAVVRNSWCIIDPRGAVHSMPDEAAARAEWEHGEVFIGQIVGGVVCDEHGEPLEPVEA